MELSKFKVGQIWQHGRYFIKITKITAKRLNYHYSTGDHNGPWAAGDFAGPSKFNNYTLFEEAK